MSGVDARLVVGADGLLHHINVAGVLSAADVHVAQRLGRLSGETDERVLLAVALAVRAVRAGSVCVSLDDVADVASAEAAATETQPLSVPWPELEAWESACRASPLVAVGVDGDPGRPVRWVDGRLYLDRYWRQEQVVRREMEARLAATADDVDVARLVEVLSGVYARDAATGFEPTEAQTLAAAVAAVSRVTVLTGGPGTGKTTTVARILAVLASVAAQPLRIALAAPTGKAAARLQEAVRAEAAAVPVQYRGGLGGLSAMTVHRLLGSRPGSTTRFRHDRSNRLPHDVVVVDETSMMSMTLMSRLLDALRPQARLVLVGDPDQLASVEAGAVLGDLVARPVVAGALPAAVRRLVPQLVDADREAALANGVVRLERSHRFGGAIGDLAQAIRAGDAGRALEVLRSRDAAVEFVEHDDADAFDVSGLREDAVTAGAAVNMAAMRGEVPGALAALEKHRLLVAHRRGPAGVLHWSAQVEAWLGEWSDDVRTDEQWFVGRPLLVTANDPDTGLYNGDTGVVVAEGTGAVAAFGTPDAPVRVPPHRLGAVQTVYAMTVHRGQGSQFERVSVVLPPASSPLLTRELLYTAVTRAKQFVRVVGSEQAVRTAVDTPVRRASGLRAPLESSAQEVP